MSDAFAGFDFGNQAQNAIAHAQQRGEEYAVKARKIATEGTIEKSLGSAKLLITGKKISEETLKAAKPYVKQQLKKGLESAKDEAKSFAEKWGGKSEDELAKASEGVLTKFQNPTFDPTGNVFGELQEGDIAAVPETSLPEDGSMIVTSRAAVGGGKPVKTIPEEEEGELETDPVKEDVTEDTTEDVTEDLGDEAGTLASTAASEGSTAVAGAKASIAAAKAAIQTTKDSVAAAKATAEKLAAGTGEKEVGAEVGTEVGEITLGETAGAVLDAIPGLNWLGLIVGAATTAAGVEEMKHKPKMPPVPLANFSGSSFQVGVN